jgi:regulator of PEP synthase PpsR (kinase-PPPase family)
MSEIPQIPIPLINYVKLIKKREMPYYQIVQFLLKDMEMHCACPEKSEVVYTINLRVLQEEIEKRIRSEKITTVNICRTILALLHGSKLSEGEDFYITTTSGGRKNYHIKVNPETLSRLSSLL